jgi:putative sigma-54 modulation protein
MRLDLTGRHVEITPALRTLVDAKLARLERVLKDAAVSAQVVLTREKHNRRADVTLHARGEKFLHGIGAAVAWEPAMAEAMDRIVQQAKRVKGKWQERKRRGRKSAVIPAETAPAQPAEAPGGPSRVRLRMPRVLRGSRQAIKAMSVADAVREADANGEGVVVFRDSETSAIAVIYRRSSGELTLVETEA